MRIDYQATREEKKALRTKRVDRIVVTVMRGETALLFDGDEESQKRLDRYARRMRANETPAIPWVMADNTEIVVTADEMEEALDLAMRRMGELWFL
jgi:hypothetical protein